MEIVINKSVIIIILVIAVLASAGFAYFALQKNKIKPPITLGSKTNEGGGLSVEVEPINFSFSNPVKLKIAFTTHQGDLNFDLTKISYLLDDKNNKYFPERWDGGSGGHHLEGTLYFLGPIKETKTIKFVIENVYSVEKREFFWQIK